METGRRFWKVLESSTKFYKVLLHSKIFYRVLRDIMELSCDLLEGSTRFCNILQSSCIALVIMIEHSGRFRNILGSFWKVPEYTSEYYVAVHLGYIYSLVMNDSKVIILPNVS